MSEEQKVLSDAEAEQEFERADEAFRKQEDHKKAEEKYPKRVENSETAQGGASDKTPSGKEETAEGNQLILSALGLKRYEDAGVVKYNIRVMNIKIGVTFNETSPLGKLWAYKIPEGDEDKKFLKNGELAEHPLIQKYRAIQEGKEALPETSVTGKILEKRGKAIKVEITENGETKEIFYGQGAVKKNDEGYFIPAGFSKGGKDKEGKERDAKMNLPRDIQLPDYPTQLSQVPTADVTKEQEGGKAEVKPTEKATLAEVIAPKELEGATPPEGEKPTIPELIARYLEILSLVTEAVAKEDRIKDREKGYAVKFIYYSVKGAIENGKGGDHEES